MAKFTVKITETVDNVWEYEGIEAKDEASAKEIAIDKSNGESAHASEPQDEVWVDATEEVKT